jgi:hypothetical protein
MSRCGWAGLGARGQERSVGVFRAGAVLVVFCTTQVPASLPCPPRYRMVFRTCMHECLWRDSGRRARHRELQSVHLLLPHRTLPPPAARRRQPRSCPNCISAVMYVYSSFVCAVIAVEGRVVWSAGGCVQCVFLFFCSSLAHLVNMLPPAL